MNIPFGFNVQSVIPLPGYFSSDEPATVSIDYGEVPDHLPGATLVRVCAQARPGQFLLHLEGVARYLVSGGNRIVMERAPGAGDEEVRLFLMGPVWSALLLQRGLLPLHGSGIMVKDKAVLFAGPSSCGKSALAAAFRQRGYTWLSDELCALAVNGGERPPTLLPGFPQTLLWADALEKLGIDKNQLVRVRQDLEKYILPTAAPGQAGIAAPVPVASVYILTQVNTPAYTVTSLNGMKRIHGLIDTTCRLHQVEGLDLKTAHFKQCGQAARHIAVKRVERPSEPFDIDTLANILEKDF